jgi:hypothetical protein
MSEGNVAAKLSPNEEKLLNTMMNLGLRDARPRRTDHTIVYGGLEEIIKELGGVETRKLLKSLASKGYLEEKNYDSVVTCPNCESVNILSKYSCPHCESISIYKVQLLEHPICGYIGNRSDFETAGELLCPKCKTRLGSFATARSKNQEDKSKIIRVIGSSYLCEKCGSKFEKPRIAHVCEQCSTTFTYREANYDRFPAYELTEKTNSLAPAGLETDKLRQIEKQLTEKGYTVELNAKIRGKSGVDQHFSIVARRDGKTLLLDISNWGKQNDLISLLGKRTDIESQSIILLDMTGNPDLEALGRAYNITVLNGKDEGYLEKLSILLLEAGTKKEEDKHRKPFSWRGREAKKQ